MQHDQYIPFREKPNIDQFNLLITPVQALLNAYHYTERGKVSHIQYIANTWNEPQPHEGHFKVSYKLTFTHGCQDLCHEECRQMIILFRMNNTTQTLFLQGEYFPERYPDEI